MPPFRETYKMFFPSLIPLLGIWVASLAYNNQIILYTFYFVGFFVVVWGIGIIYSIRRPRVNITNIMNRWFGKDLQTFTFDIVTAEKDLYLEKKLIITGFIPAIVGGEHDKKKVKYKYSINKIDTEIKPQEKNISAMARFKRDPLVGFLHFQTITFSFIGGGKKKIRYIRSADNKPISIFKYWLVVGYYLLFNKVAGTDYWRDKSYNEHPNNSPIDHT